MRKAYPFVRVLATFLWLPGRPANQFGERRHERSGHCYTCGRMSENPVDSHEAPAEDFYSKLPLIERFFDVTDLGRYSDVPPSWLMVITDVRGSTQAIEQGRYRDVNALGVASIIGMKNAQRDLEVPFVFGGDGATLLVPGSRREVTERALRGTRRLAEDVFGLGLRASLVPVAELYAAGHIPRVAPFRASPHTRLAMFAGQAYALAESWVKQPGARFEVSHEGPSEVDFEGFECRWQPIPSQRGSTVTLLILALVPEETERVATYRRVLQQLHGVADPELFRPVVAPALKMKGVFADYSLEARVRSQRRGGPEFNRAASQARKAATVGRVLTSLKFDAFEFDGASYKAEVEQNTDFRKFDETLRMVLDLSDDEFARVTALLERERALGNIAYGTHQAGAALMTCLVRSYRGDHVHFVDGADGGYALAAKQLKAQLAQDRSNSSPEA